MLLSLTERKTYVPPFKTTSVQEFFELSRAVVGSTKLSSDFCSTLLRRLLRPVCHSAGPDTGLGELTKHKDRQDGVLK